MSINKTLALKWGDKSYDIKVNMGLIDRVDEEINAIKMLNRAYQGDIRFTEVARLVSILLQSVDVNVDHEEVWEGMFGGGKTTMQEAAAFATEVLSAMFPTPKKKPQPASRRSPSKSTRGKTSTK